MWRKSIGNDTGYFCPKLCHDKTQGCSMVAGGVMENSRGYLGASEQGSVNKLMM